MNSEARDPGKPTARTVRAWGMLLELVLCLFPPMQIRMQQEGGFTIGNTIHYFVLSNIRGGWMIDIGRFIVYSVLILAATYLVAFLLDQPSRASGATGDTP